jgi:chromosome segregation ATPase
MKESLRTHLESMAKDWTGMTAASCQAALTEIDELSTANAYISRRLDDTSFNLNVAQGEIETHKRTIEFQAKCIEQANARSVQFQRDYADAMTENSHLKCRLESSYSADYIGHLREEVCTLQAKLAAPPETLAMTEIHNRLSRLESTVEASLGKKWAIHNENGHSRITVESK